jgi:hypothetical protein
MNASSACLYDLTGHFATFQQEAALSVSRFSLRFVADAAVFPSFPLPFLPVITSTAQSREFP